MKPRIVREGNEAARYFAALDRPNNLSMDHPCVHKACRKELHANPMNEYTYEGYVLKLRTVLSEYNGKVVESPEGHHYSYVHFDTLEDAAVFMLQFA